MPSSRIVSLDQFRGYTVAGMLFVNFFSGYAAIPPVFQHHNTYCSYADTIMPQFLFAVGFAFRLTLLRRLQEVSPAAAYLAVLKRSLGLCLLGLVVHRLDGGAKTWEELTDLGFSGFLTTAFQRSPFQTLVHIGVTSLWVMPAIAASATSRVAYLGASAALHVWISQSFYYDWVMKRPGIDGGPLGFLTWTIPLLVGSLAYDARVSGRAYLRSFATWSTILMIFGYALSCLGGTIAAPPFVPPGDSADVDPWTMSQRAGSVSYLFFSSGFSLAVYAVFAKLFDVDQRTPIGVFRTFGRNALVAYILHMLVAATIKPYVPKDAPLWYDFAAFGIFFWITYSFVAYLEKHDILIKL